MGSSTLQGELWGAAARDWAEIQEPLHRPVWEVMLDSAKVGGGTRLLDAGCGAGGASIAAAQRGARVSGLDASETLIAIARENVPQGDFRVGDLQALPYGENAFDAIIAAMSVQYATEPIEALRELRRVCAPGGYLVISTWGSPQDCDQRFIFKAVRETLPAPPSGGGPFSLSADGALEGFVEQAGWKVEGSGEVACPFEYENLETHWRAQRSAGPLQAAFRSVDEERIREAVEQAIEPCRTTAGGVLLENCFRYVTAVT